MLASATIDAKSDQGSHGTTTRILLTCALIRSRQHMTADVAFTARVKNAADSRLRSIGLIIDERDTFGDLISHIDGLGAHHPNITSGDGEVDGEGEGDQDITLTVEGSCWTVQGEFPVSHGTCFEQTFQHVYRQVCEASPERPSSQIEVIRHDDVEWLIRNAVKEVPPPKDLDGARLFQQCMTEWREDVAVEAWDGTLTYAELDQTSTRLAGVLMTHGVLPGTILPLLFQFSKWTVISVLATWKAGAAFVFIDPTHPTKRIQNLVQQVQATIVLAQQKWPNVELDAKVRILLLDEMEANLDEAQHVDGLSLPMVDSQSPAYLIFTSGSTGQPKAALHTHFAFCSGALAQADLLGFSRGTRTMENAPLIFAGAIPELLFTILKGGRICIARLEDRTKDLVGCVRKMQTNMLIISSSVAAAHNPAQFTPRHRILMGAEPLPSDTAKKWAAFHDNCNGYGSTETNTVATCSKIDCAISTRNVGRGAAHQYWVVDSLDHNRLLPPGWLGEVVVEGHALASEYLGDTEATEKAFPPPPKWCSMVPRQSPTARFFRTGDLGRIASDGGLEVHGRTDPLQVKLRGQRIELGEIEAVTREIFTSTPFVVELIHPSAQGRPSIALFFVATNLVEGLGDDFFARDIVLNVEQKQQLAHVRERVKTLWDSRLPAFMWPSYLVPLSALPRTQTGKLDRRRLRDWASLYQPIDMTSLSTSQTGSQTSSELTTKVGQQIRSAVAKVLTIRPDQVNGSAAFTVLGGDSLNAIALTQELRDHDLMITPAEIIRADSLQSIASVVNENSATWIDENSTGNISLGIPAKDLPLQKLQMAAGQVHSVLPTTDSQSRAIKLGTGPERSFVYHFMLKFLGEVDQERLERSLHKLITRHDVLRTMFTELDGTIVQLILEQAEGLVEVRNVEDESALQATIDVLASGDIRINQVPTKIYLILMNRKAVRVVFRLSHAQFDGLSIPILWDSLKECYDAEIVCPAPEYSTYIREVLGSSPTPALDYYTELLRDVPFTDLVKRTTQSHEPQNCHRHQRLTLKQSVGHTPATLVEAAWGYVLACASQCRAVAFDQIVSGRQLSHRSKVDIRNLVGACLNDVPVVVKHPSGQTVHSLMKQIQDQRATSAMHETLGFSEILSKCKPDHWPANARMTSSVQYRGFEEKTSFQLGDVKCIASMVERSMDLEDLTVLVTPLRGQVSNEYNIEFLFSDRVVSQEQADSWFQQLLRAVEAFARDENLEVEVEALLGRIHES